MTEPWQCPACKTWLAPRVTEHRCDPEGGVGAVRPAEPPSGPTTVTSIWPTGGTTATTGMGWTATNVTMTFDGTQLTEASLRHLRNAHRRRNPGAASGLRVA